MKALTLFLFGTLLAPFGHAASTINTNNSFAWSANAGWVNWRGDGANGAVIGEYIATGYLWCANLGWVSLGSGTLANGIRYANNSATDFGVSLMSDGTLRGFAYGANIGWVNFEALGNPRINLRTGGFSGFAWSANVGWINLGDVTYHPVTDSVVDTDGDGITDAWELEHAGNLTTFTATGDADTTGRSTSMSM